MISYKVTAAVLLSLVLSLVGTLWTVTHGGDVDNAARLADLEKTRAPRSELAALDAKKADRTQIDEINRRLTSIETDVRESRNDIKELLRRK